MRGPAPSSSPARVRMERQRRRNTSPERRLRSALHRRGLRFRLHRRVVPLTRREADIVFTTERVAVFVDGCFWHGCSEHGTAPRANAAFWRAKIRANQERDRDTDQRLARDGWQVVRVWEHEDPEAAAARISAVVRTRRRFPARERTR